MAAVRPNTLSRFQEPPLCMAAPSSVRMSVRPKMLQCSGHNGQPEDGTCASRPDAERTRFHLDYAPLRESQASTSVSSPFVGLSSIARQNREPRHHGPLAAHCAAAWKAGAQVRRSCSSHETSARRIRERTHSGWGLMITPEHSGSASPARAMVIFPEERFAPNGAGPPQTGPRHR
jgi:hypothetical protein